MNKTTASAPRTGSDWLVEPTAPVDVFTPEGLGEEHRLIARTTDEFVDKEVVPFIDQLETKDWALNRSLVRRAAELGLIATDVPEAYGGVALDKVSSVVVAERIARTASFGSTFGAQTGLTIIPILCFGTSDQKQRYLPRLASGELIGAYALSEAGSGSDALGARCRATRQADGSFVLSGEKMWITNCAFADVFIVFAKVEGEHFSAFIVEREFAGVSHGKEEHKMGLHGSSTAPLILQDVPVPAANLLGEVGRGHKVAFNVLNYGRFKLGAMTTGSAKHALGDAARYATSRVQFGRPIARFGAIQHKLAEMVVRLHGVESALYRTAGLIDAMLAGADPDDGARVVAALEEFAIESSIAKVSGSEMLDFVLDENVQIHGGNGYVRDYPAERMYRDARVNRIFEGTNEINRLLIPTMLLRRAARGVVPLGEPSGALEAGPAGGPASDPASAVEGFKRASRMVLGLAVDRYGEALSDQQEILTGIADILIDTYTAESAVLRAERAAATGSSRAALHRTAVEVFVAGAASRIQHAGTEVLSAMTDDAERAATVSRLRATTDVAPIDTVARRRTLAEAAIERGGYVFDR